MSGVKRLVLMATAAVLAALSLVACGDAGGGSSSAGGAAKHEPPQPAKTSWGTFTLDKRIADKVRNGEKLNLALSISGTGAPIFGGAMKSGLERGIAEAQKEFGTSFSSDFIGPVSQDIPAQVSEIRSRLGAKSVDCLMLMAADPGPYVSTINQAIDAGVPVFSVNTDVPESKRLGFYALDELAAGRMAGELTAEQVKKQGKGIKKVAMLTGSTTLPATRDRMKGFQEAFGKAYPQAKFVNDPRTAPETTFDGPEAYTAARNFIAGNPDVDLIFHTDQGVQQVAKAIVDLKRQGKVIASGFNLSTEIVNYVESGEIIATIAQGWNKQAAAGVNACAQYLYNGTLPDPPIQHLDPVAVSKDNVAEFKGNVEAGA